MADLIATGYGGRNRLCAEEFCNQIIQSHEIDSAVIWKDVERRLLGGQRMQGLATCDQLVVYIEAHGGRERFPLFFRIHSIARQGADPRTLFDW
jgi:glycerol-3-phosphate dehydrogenase (NAD+)